MEPLSRKVKKKTIGNYSSQLQTVSSNSKGSRMSTTILNDFWKNKSLIVATFGLVGAGAAIGAGSVYIFYLRSRLDRIFKIQTSLTIQLQTLRKELDKVNQHFDQNNRTVPSEDETLTLNRDSKNLIYDVNDIALLNTSKPTVTMKERNISCLGRRTVRFRDGYETADDEEYVTASSDSDVELTPEKSQNKEKLTHGPK